MLRKPRYSGYRALTHLVGTVGVNAVDQVPVLILHVLEADIAQDTGVVKENIDATEVLDGGVDDTGAVLDAVVVCDRLTTGGADLVDDDIGGLDRVSSVLVCEWRCRITLADWPSPLWEPPRSFTTTLAPLEAKKRA